MGWPTLQDTIYLVQHHVPGTAQDQSSQSRQTIISPILQMEKTEAQSKLLKAMQHGVIWLRLAQAQHRQLWPPLGALSAPRPLKSDCPVCTGPLLQAGLRDLV